MKRFFACFLIFCIFALSGCNQSALVAESDQEAEMVNSTDSLDFPPREAAAEISITLDPNCEDTVSTTFNIQPGEMIDPAQLTVNYRYGYNQIGYFLDADCTKPVEENASFQEDTILYAGWEKWSEETKNLMDVYLEEKAQYNMIGSYPLAFEKESFTNYYKIAKRFFGSGLNGFTVDQMDRLQAVKTARDELQTLTDDWDSTVWYIWGDEMPEAPDASDYDYYLALDYPGFRPFLVPYLVEDQSSVKGNIIVIAGGGFTDRSNLYEGYATAEYFQSQNYNAYVLQRRVSPSEEIDSSLDLQRAIRYLQANAESLGIGMSENISACGYSGGGMTISNYIQYFKEDTLPSEIYSDYKTDSTDEISASLDAILIIYGAPAGGFDDVESLTLPETFIACGEEDIARQNCLDLYDQIVDLTRTELYVYADAVHGVAMGETTYGTCTAATQWPALATTFLDITYGYKLASVDAAN